MLMDKRVCFLFICFSFLILFVGGIVVPADSRSIADQSTVNGSRRFLERMDFMDAVFEDLRWRGFRSDAPLPHTSFQVNHIIILVQLNFIFDDLLHDIIFFLIS